MGARGQGTGPLVLLGDDAGRPVDDELGHLVEAAGGPLLVLPTASAYERPDRAVERAARRFAPTAVRACAVLRRADAEDPERAAEVATARAIYLCGASPLHLRSVLKDSPVLQALLAAWRDGALLVAAGPAATVVSDPMVDPRGGAFTVGLGLVRDVAFAVGAERDEAQLRRTLALAPPPCAVVALGADGCLWRAADGTWRTGAAGDVDVYLAGLPAGLEELAGKTLHPALERTGTPR